MRAWNTENKFNTLTKYCKILLCTAKTSRNYTALQSHPCLHLRIKLAKFLLICPVCLCDKGAVSVLCWWVASPDWGSTHSTACLSGRAALALTEWCGSYHCLCATDCSDVFECAMCYVCVPCYCLCPLPAQTWASVWHLFAFLFAHRIAFVSGCMHILHGKSYLLEEREGEDG